MLDGLRLRIRSESGMTLPELLVTMVIVTIVLIVFLGTLASVQRTYQREADRSETNDQSRLAIEELDREIRSGNVLYDPAQEIDSDPTHDIAPGMSLRIYTQTNANSRPGFRCVQWRVTSTGDLQRRSWLPNEPDTATGWRVLASNLTNRSVNPPVAVFSLDTSSASYGSRLVKIVLLVNRNAKSGQDVRIQSSIEGRNTTFGYPNSACAEIPAY